MKKLEQTLSKWFGKLPNLPANVREVLVKLAPYFAIIGLVLSLPVILFALGLGFIAGPILAVGGMWAAASGGVLAMVYAIVSVVLLGLSISGLFARHSEGWRYLYYNALVGAVYSILNMDLGGLVIGTGISLYILFQIRSHYK
jgi:hypothetical protein